MDPSFLLLLLLLRLAAGACAGARAGARPSPNPKSCAFVARSSLLPDCRSTVEPLGDVQEKKTPLG